METRTPSHVPQAIGTVTTVTHYKTAEIPNILHYSSDEIHSIATILYDHLVIQLPHQPQHQGNVP